MSPALRVFTITACFLIVSAGVAIDFAIRELSPRGAIKSNPSGAPNAPNHAGKPFSGNSIHSKPAVPSTDAMSVSIPSVKAKPAPSAEPVPDPEPSAQAPPLEPITILFFHGGGWNRGAPEEMEPLAKRYRAWGYRVLTVPYRNSGDNIVQQLTYSKKVAGSISGTVLAYGVSAGGTIAATLAAIGAVEGAVVVVAPTDLPTWTASTPYYSSEQHWRDLGMSQSDLKIASPLRWLGAHPAPQYLQYMADDPVVPLEQGNQYFSAAKAKQPDTSLTVMNGKGHAYPAEYAVGAAQWISDRWKP